MAVEIMDSKGGIWLLSLRDVRQLRLNQEVFGTRHTAGLLRFLGYPIEVALAVLAR